MKEFRNPLFVTGAAGFIGSTVVRRALQSGFSIVAIDSLTYAGNLSSLDEVSQVPAFHFEKVDVCDREGIAALFDKWNPCGILHLAAESHVDRSIDGPGEFIRTNIDGTFTLLECSRNFYPKASCPDSFRFLHVSTDEVYGDLESADDPFLETTPYAPSSPYAASKAASDHLVRAWHRTYGLPILITNCSNNYGPRQFPEKLIPHMIFNALSGKSLPVYGDGSQIRDWLHVEDHADALLSVFQKGTPGETYNVGGDNQVQNIEVVKIICRLLEQLAPSSGARYEDLIQFVADRPGHDRRYAIDASKIQTELGWAPAHTFDTGMEETVRWYLDNREWSDKVFSGDYRLERKGE